MRGGNSIGYASTGRLCDRRWAPLVVVLLSLMSLLLAIVAVHAGRRRMARREADTTCCLPSSAEILSMVFERPESGGTFNQYAIRSVNWSTVLAALSSWRQCRLYLPGATLVGRIEIRKRDSSSAWVNLYSLPDPDVGGFSVTTANGLPAEDYSIGNVNPLKDALNAAIGTSWSEDP
jgi:hypothetical protein